jgi:hypothetical protein
MTAALALALAAAVNAPEALSRLRSLEGKWSGTYEWTGRADKGETVATYHVTGNGSAVIEDLAMNGKPSMTSAYHLDNGDLRMTHYCGAGNQPRLKASAVDLAANRFRFELLDITNLAAPDAPHVQGFTLQIVDNDHLVLDFDFTAKGKSSVEHIVLTRAS